MMLGTSSGQALGLEDPVLHTVDPLRRALAVRVLDAVVASGERFGDVAVDVTGPAEGADRVPGASP
jgi:hypothetical protein